MSTDAHHNHSGEAATASSGPRTARPTSASAPAKLILCGEHAVVYGRPAIALPIAGVRATVQVEPATSGGIVFVAKDLRHRWRLRDERGRPLSALVTQIIRRYAGGTEPDARITLSSTIPIASGMGSGAAVATALVRALVAYLGATLEPSEVSELVYESERHFHGTPSGIDNTVIAYEQPLWFERRNDPAHEHPSVLMEPISIATPLQLLIGDTGVRSPTRLPVGEVRRRWEQDRPRYEGLFDAVAAVVHGSREALARGAIAELGALLSQNHGYLQEIGVSSPELDRLVRAACAAGALGAKLSGAGWGGAMLALVTDDTRAPVADALRAAGSAQVLESRVDPSGTRGPGQV